MVVHLSGELERRIQEKVNSGRYRTADEVIGQALRALDDQSERGEGEGERLSLGDLPGILASLSHLDPGDVDAFEADLKAARLEVSRPSDPWES